MPQIDLIPSANFNPSAHSRFPAKVLLVEDNEVNKEVAQNILELLGCTVTAVENGAQALQAIEISEYDIVFMDCHMPVMDGIEATKQIRKREEAKNHHLTIIGLSANIIKENQDAMFKAGLDDYLCKPFGIEDMSLMLNKWLKHKRLVSEKLANESAYDLFDHRLFDTLIKIQYTGHLSMGEDVLKLFIHESDRQLAIINEKSKTHIDKHCFDAIDKLRISSLSIGAKTFSKICHDVESAARQDDKFLLQEILTQLNKVHEKLVKQIDTFFEQHAVSLTERTVS